MNLHLAVKISLFIEANIGLLYTQKETDLWKNGVRTKCSNAPDSR